jgi:ATP-dependent DNA helicase RecG
LAADWKALLDKLLLGGGEEPPARLHHLLFHKPYSYIDRSARPQIADVADGQIVTLNVRVLYHEPGPGARGRNSRKPYKVYGEDDSGTLSLVFFSPRKDWLEATLPEGAQRLISGRVERRGEWIQMIHPDYILEPDQADSLPTVEAIYNSTAGLAAKTTRKLIVQALQLLPDEASLSEWQRPDVMASLGFDSFQTSLRALHTPSAPDQKALETARQRLAFDELLANQLALALLRHHHKKTKGLSRNSSGKLIEQLRQILPFQLTASQEKAIVDIREDLSKPERMLRLLQGDVGAGKTLVALCAALHVIECDQQVAFMAPHGSSGSSAFSKHRGMVPQAWRACQPVDRQG